MRLALFQPDIPQNLGAAIRLSACLGIFLDVIEPCAFPLSDRTLKRAALDYTDKVGITLHAAWERFLDSPGRDEGRLVLFTTKAAQPYTDFRFQAGDTLLFGRESAGVPDEVHNAAQARLVIPLQPGLRSLNIVSAAAMALGEALRQTDAFPKSAHPRDREVEARSSQSGDPGFLPHANTASDHRDSADLADGQKTPGSPLSRG
jgi:tRNA (cytidine/uridine-2'-O-)-methyltransferase